jgi:hypothetical protein
LARTDSLSFLEIIFYAWLHDKGLNFGRQPVDFRRMALGTKIGRRPSDMAATFALLKSELVLLTPLPKGAVVFKRRRHYILANITFKNGLL